MRPFSRVQGDAVLRSRQVLGREPEVDRVARHVVQGPRGRELGLERLLAAVHRRRRLADHLDVAQRVLEVVAAEVEVVEAERLLEDGRVLLLGQGEHGLAVVEGVVATELIGPVGEAVRVLLGGRGEQQLGRVGRSARDDDDVRAVGLAGALAVDGDLRHGGAARVGVERHGLGVSQQRDVRVLERRAHREHLRVGLGVHEAGEAVAGGAADAVAVGHVGLVQHHPAGGVEGLVSGGGEVVRELLDPRLVRHRREGVGRAGGRLGRVLAARAVHLVELLGLRVVRLHLVVADGPGGRDAVVVAEARRSPPRAAGRAPPRRSSWRRRRSSAPAAGRACPSRRTSCPPRCSGCRRTRPPRSSSAARASASRRAPAAGCACRRGRGGARACRRRRRCRSR